MLLGAKSPIVFRLRQAVHPPPNVRVELDGGRHDAGVYRRWGWLATGKNLALKGVVVPFQYKEFFVTIKIAPDGTVLTWYTPTVEIRRNETDEYPLITLTCSTSRRTEEDAHNLGVELAMKWINDHPLGQ